MPVAPRIVNDVSYVMRINHEIHFAWQAQYLVRLEVDACCWARGRFGRIFWIASGANFGSLRGVAPGANC